MAQTDEKSTRDEIVVEMRRIKEEMSKSFDFDIGRILDDARERQKESGRTIVAPPNRESI